MKDFLKKYCPIFAKILSIPILLCGIFCFFLDFIGYDRIDEFLASVRFPFDSTQILFVGCILILLWLPCIVVSERNKSQEAKAASEAALKARLTESFAPGQTDTPLRTAAKDVKCRILLERTVGAYRICYRRVGKTNELVVNGMVYDDMTATFEKKHELIAKVDGYDIRVGFDGNLYSYITFDGVIAARKARLF